MRESRLAASDDSAVAAAGAHAPFGGTRGGALCGDPHFGWIAPQGYSQAPSFTELDDEGSDFVRVRRKNWARLIAKTFLSDPELCPKCGERMKLVAAISSPAQDDVIERILRHIGAWNPPWRRQPKARAPPRQRELFSDHSGSQLPAIEEEDVNQDASHFD